MLKLLFTGNDFRFYSGSQMYICELAEYFQTKGYHITIASGYLSDNMTIKLKSKNINIIKANALPLDDIFDLVLAFHYPLITKLILKGLKFKQIINFCLSPYEKLENPVRFHHELPLIVANSQETKNKLINFDNIPENKVFILPNFLPDSFINLNIKLTNELKNIAVISNHIPNELAKLTNNTHGIHFHYIGIKYQQIEITPEYLSKFDAIISIGKTVQYCLGMRIPIFEYDRFGGCGYISIDNYESEKNKNFSGRATNRKLTSAEIIDELINGYNNALRESKLLQEKAINDFSYHNIDKMLNLISSYDTIDYNRFKENIKNYTKIKLIKKIKINNNRVRLYLFGRKFLSIKLNKNKNGVAYYIFDNGEYLILD